jgi:hypothetical protein
MVKLELLEHLAVLLSLPMHAIGRPFTVIWTCFLALTIHLYSYRLLTLGQTLG